MWSGSCLDQRWRAACSPRNSRVELDTVDVGERRVLRLAIPGWVEQIPTATAAIDARRARIANPGARGPSRRSSVQWRRRSKVRPYRADARTTSRSAMRRPRAPMRSPARSKRSAPHASPRGNSLAGFVFRHASSPSCSPRSVADGRCAGTARHRGVMLRFRRCPRFAQGPRTILVPAPRRMVLAVEVARPTARQLIDLIAKGHRGSRSRSTRFHAAASFYLEHGEPRLARGRRGALPRGPDAILLGARRLGTAPMAPRSRCAMPRATRRWPGWSPGDRQPHQASICTPTSGRCAAFRAPSTACRGQVPAGVVARRPWTMVIIRRRNTEGLYSGIGRAHRRPGHRSARHHAAGLRGA